MSQFKESFNELFNLFVLGIIFLSGMNWLIETTEKSTFDYCIIWVMILFSITSICFIYAMLYYKPILDSRKRILLNYRDRIAIARKAMNHREADILHRACNLYIGTFLNDPMLIEDDDVNDLVTVCAY